MSPIMSCTAGNTVEECTAYTAHYFDQISATHNNLMIIQNELFVLLFAIGLLLGFLITYLIVYFYKL